MNDLLLVDILQSTDDLVAIILCFHFSYSLSPLYQLVQSLVRADLQQNIDVLGVLEGVFEAHHVGRFQVFVDFDFRLQLRVKDACTFYFAFDLVKEAFSMTLAA